MTNEEFDSCMERVRAGDRDGLKEIYQAYIAYIYSIISAFVREREDAEDLCADFFLKLWEQAGKYRAGGGHRAWLGAMARNMAIDFIRRSGREMPREDAAEAAQERGADSHPSAEDESLARLSFSETVERLPEDQRTIVTMKILGDMTFKEIASALKMPMGTVTWKYRDSMEKLRRAEV